MPGNDFGQGEKMLKLFRGLFKKEVRVPRRVYVPEAHKKELLEAWDLFKMAPSPGNCTVRYLFWKEAAKICPEIADGGRWKFNPINGILPYFEEMVDK